MTWVKICGITNLEDALIAVESGADALGFVFYQKSPRKVDVETAREIVAKLPERVEKVGVFPGEDCDFVIDVTRQVPLSAMQLYLSESNLCGCRGLTSDRTKMFVATQATRFMDHNVDLNEIMSMFRSLTSHDPNGRLVDAIFLDSGTRDLPGGTGKTFDWEKTAPIVSEISRAFNVVIAGGLNPANVAEAMRVLRPWGVDVASGVEARPGRKDPEKVKAFIAAVREADKVH